MRKQPLRILPLLCTILLLAACGAVPVRSPETTWVTEETTAPELPQTEAPEPAPERFLPPQPPVP